MHEHLFGFRKPTPDENLAGLKYSMHWQGNEAATEAAIKHIELLLAAHGIPEDEIVRALKKKSKEVSKKT
jgi:hypothetical protein